MVGTSGVGGRLLGFVAKIVSDPVDQLGGPCHGAVATIRLVGMVCGELGQLVWSKGSVGRQSSTLAGHGEVLGIRLPVQGHRELVGTGGQWLAVIALPGCSIEN
jgi:hypothetical protein